MSIRVNQDQSAYEVVAYRRPRLGELYLYEQGVLRAYGPSSEYNTSVYIVEEKPDPYVLQPVNVSTVLSFDVAGTETPVLVAEFFDAEGQSSTLTFYDADLAARFYDR